MHATLESMNEGQSAPPVQGKPDDKPSRSSAGVPEVSRSEAEAGLDPVAEQSNPAPSGVDAGGSSQTGALASLLLKISATPIEVVRAVGELGVLIDKRVIGAISAFRTEIVARIDANDAKSKARMDAHEANSRVRMDAIDAKVEANRTDLRLFLAVIFLLLILFTVLIHLGATDRSSVEDTSTLSTKEEAEAPIPDVEEPTTATSNPTQGAIPTSRETAGPNGDKSTADGSSRSKGSLQLRAAKHADPLTASRSDSSYEAIRCLEVMRCVALLCLDAPSPTAHTICMLRWSR